MWTNLKQTIAQTIKANGNAEITGSNLQIELFRTIDALGAGYMFIGCVDPGFTPGALDSKVFALASVSGTYAGLAIPTSGVHVIMFDGVAWSYKTLMQNFAATQRTLLSCYTNADYTTILPYSANLTEQVLLPVTVKKNVNFISETVGGLPRFRYTGSETIHLQFAMTTAIRAAVNDAKLKLALHVNGSPILGVNSLEHVAKNTDTDNISVMGEIFDVAPNTHFNVYATSTISSAYTFSNSYFSLIQI